MKRHLSMFGALMLLVSVVLTAQSPVASAAPKCPVPSKDGRTIATIKAGPVTADVKRITYPAGGALNPPASPSNVGLSSRHQPLSADEGTSLLVWHINWNGCQGKLNLLIDKKAGYTFNVTDENGNTKKYVITSTRFAQKGDYEPEWFYLNGPRKLMFVTCITPFRDGHYQRNFIAFASPVE